MVVVILNPMARHIFHYNHNNLKGDSMKITFFALMGFIAFTSGCMLAGREKNDIGTVVAFVFSSVAMFMTMTI